MPYVKYFKFSLASAASMGPFLGIGSADDAPSLGAFSCAVLSVETEVTDDVVVFSRQRADRYLVRRFRKILA